MPIAILLLIKIIWFSRYGILYSCKEVSWLMEGFNVSVVVPTFNRVDFVLEAIKSISSQTFQPLEIILVDNNSEDNTTEMVAKHFKSVKILIQKKQGVSAARNFGIREASGNWIAFLDSDDQWHKRKLEEQVKSISRDKLSVDLSHTEEIWYRNKIFLNQKEIHKKRGGFIFENCLPLCCISPSSVLIRKKVFDDIGLFDESLDVCEDYDFWLRFCCKYPVNFVDQKLTIKNGGHNDQLSKKYWGMDRFRVQALENLLRSSVLDEWQRQLTKSMLLKKIKILIQGAKKRSNTSTYNKYLEKQKYWEAE